MSDHEQTDRESDQQIASDEPVAQESIAHNAGSSTDTNQSPEVDRSNETPMIEADRLSKFYGIFAASREVSFKVLLGRGRRIFGAQWCWKKHDHENVDRVPVSLGRRRPNRRL